MPMFRRVPSELTVTKLTVEGEEPIIVLDGPGKKLQLLRGADTIRQSVDAVDRSVSRANAAGYLLQTKNAADVWTNRLEVTGGVDTAEITIKNANIIPDGDMNRNIGEYGASINKVWAKQLTNPYRSVGDYGITFADIYNMDIVQANIRLGYITRNILKDFRAYDVTFGVYQHGAHGWRFQTSNAALNAALTRLAIAGGADIADVDVVNAYLDASQYSAVLRRDSGDYGGNFANYTPPTGREGLTIVAEDTNATAPGRRIYVYSGGAWRYVNLT